MNVNSFLKKVREGHSPSKAEEVELLDTLRLTHSKNPNTYLSSLFTEGFCDWVTAAIRQDTSTNMFLSMHHAYGEGIRTSKELRNEVASLERQLELARSEIATLDVGNAELDRELQANLALIEEQDDEEKRLLARIDRFEDMAASLGNLAASCWTQGKDVTPEQLRDEIAEWYPEE